MSKAVELRQERHAISLLMNAALEKNDMAEWKRLDGMQETLRTRIEAIERSSELNRYMNAVPNAERPNVSSEAYSDDPFSGQIVTGEQRDRSRVSQIRQSPVYERDFRNWLRTGESSNLIREARALGAASGADGATLVPQGFEAELIVKMKYYNGVSNICRHIATATGNPLPWPNVDDTANSAEWLTEGSGTGSEDPAFSNVTLGANLLSSKQVKVSVQLEQDSAFDMPGLLSDAFAARLGRAMDQAYYLGDGTNTYGSITGILPALQAASGRSVLAVGANANDGASTDLNSVGTDDFSNLIDKLDKAYQKPSNKFLFAQSTQNALRKLKDKYGRPVWEVSLAQGEPDKVFGFGFEIDNAVSAIGAGNVSVVFGDWTNFVVRDVLGFTLVRFNELYMTNYQRAYQAFMRTDAKLLQAAAFSYLIHPQS